MMTPATAGAAIRVPGQTDEFIATALIMSRRWIRWGKRARRAGWSKASMAPARKAMASRCHTRTRSSRVSVARPNIRTAITACAATISLRWSSRSAATPPNRLSTMAGTPLASPTYPRASGEPVSSNISQNWPNRRIWKPLTDATMANQKARKAGYRMAGGPLTLNFLTVASCCTPGAWLGDDAV